MKLLKILPIVAIALLAASRSFSYAETEPDNDNLNLDSAFQAFAKEYQSHNCENSYTVKYNFSDIDLKNLEDELYCQCVRWLRFNHSYCAGQKPGDN